jgi:hypothetical protein
MPQALKVYWEVTAGMYAGHVDPTLSRRFELTADEIAMPGLYVEKMFAALGYAARLQLQAASGLMPNVVMVEFVWL